MGIILTVERSMPEKGYTILPNHILKDKNITFKAMGILHFLFSLPPDPKLLSVESIAKKSRDGVSAVRSGIEELKIAGYLRIQQKYNTRGQYDGVEWILRDTPCGSESLAKSRKIPDVENPKSDQPRSGSHGLISTYKTKNPKSKKTTTAMAESDETLGDLRFSATMLAETQSQVRKALGQVAPCDRQRMLDDFCAAVRAGGIKKSQLGWLHAVIKRYRNGEYNFKPMSPKAAPDSSSVALPVAFPPGSPNSPPSVNKSEPSSVALEALSNLKQNRWKPN